MRLIEANQKGWGDPLIVSTLVAGVVLIAAFLYWELHSPHAMMPLRFFKIPAFSAGNTVAFAVSLGMFATFFFLSLYMQLIRGYTPFQAGVRFLPMTLMIIVTAPLAGKYASQHGSRGPMTYGLLLAGGGLLFLGTQLKVDTPYWMMLPVFVIMGHGMASVMAPMTAAVMNSVGPQRAGLGSAMTNTSREVGGVFGIALLGTILTTKLKASLTPALAGLGLTGAQQNAIAVAGGHGTLDPSVLKGLSPAQVARGDARIRTVLHGRVPRGAVRRRAGAGGSRRSSRTGSSPAATPSTCRRPGDHVSGRRRGLGPRYVDLRHDHTAHDRAFSDLWPKGGCGPPGPPATVSAPKQGGAA